MPADDVGFVDAIMADLDSRLPIDRHRVYASGFSNGAGFTARLSVERSTRIAAAAYSAGGLLEGTGAGPRGADVHHGSARSTTGSSRTGLAELPLDPVEILSEPVLGSFVDSHLATLGLDGGDFGAAAGPTSTLLRWPERPTARVPVRDARRASSTGIPTADNNPAGFAAAPEFWEFFRAHRLP